MKTRSADLVGNGSNEKGNRSAVFNGGLWTWIRENLFCAIIVTLVMCDWVPTVILEELGYGRWNVTGTKLWIVPVTFVVIFSFVQRLSNRLLPVSSWIGFIAVNIGVGAGVLLGTVDSQWYITIIASCLLVMYFQNIKSLESVNHILLLAVYLTAANGIAQYLGELGILQPIVESKTNDGMMERNFVGGNTSSVGFIPLFAAASFGGLLLTRNKRGNGFLAHAVSFCLIFIGALGIVIAAQRSSAIAFSFALLSSLIYYLVKSKIRNIAGLSVMIAMCIGAIILTEKSLSKYIVSTEYRFTDSQQGRSAKSLDDRLTGFRKFWSDISTNPKITAPGTDDFFNEVGTLPHNVVSETYYHGGLILLITLFSGLFVIIKNIVLGLFSGKSENNQSIRIFFLILGLSSTFHFFAQTGLGLRPTAMLLGLGLSSGWQGFKKIDELEM